VLRFFLSRHAQVVDALSVDVRQQLLKSFFRKQFARYDDMYGQGSEGFALDMVDRRYSWFRTFLREYDTRFANVLPQHWNVARRMCIQFCEKTRNDIDVLLSAFDPPDSAPPETLVRQLNKTLAFEAEMVGRFETKASASSGADTLMVDENGDTIDPHSAEGVRRRYARQRAEVRSIVVCGVWCVVCGGVLVGCVFGGGLLTPRRWCCRAATATDDVQARGSCCSRKLITAQCVAAKPCQDRYNHRLTQGREERAPAAVGSTVHFQRL